MRRSYPDLAAPAKSEPAKQLRRPARSLVCGAPMLNEDSIQYAIENTQVIIAPRNRIETFGTTVFRFFLVTELMDSVNKVRVRDGRLHAERPSIITPQHYQQMLMEGFGSKAEEFVGWLRENAPDFAVLKYGFQFRKTDLQEEVVHTSMEEVVDKLRSRVDDSEDPLSAVIQGVDEGWEVCLLKFATDMIQRSAAGNMDEWRRRGLI
jgi:hypothetical protein